MADTSRVLWFAVRIPDMEDRVDSETADMMADEFVMILNEERRRNGAGRHDRLTVELFPPPQFVTIEQVQGYITYCKTLRKNGSTNG